MLVKSSFISCFSILFYNVVVLYSFLTILFRLLMCSPEQKLNGKSFSVWGVREWARPKKGGGNLSEFNLWFSFARKKLSYPFPVPSQLCETFHTHSIFNLLSGKVGISLFCDLQRFRFEFQMKFFLINSDRFLFVADVLDVKNDNKTINNSSFIFL